jgi:hypothetical protein
MLYNLSDLVKGRSITPMSQSDLARRLAAQLVDRPLTLDARAWRRRCFAGIGDPWKGFEWAL